MVALFGIVDQRAEKRRLQGLGILLQAADQVLGDEGRCFLGQEDVAVDEVEHLDREVLEPLAADQQDNREVEAASSHQIDQRRRFSFEALLAPVDHHAADGGVGLHRNFRILELVSPDDFETGALDFRDDLVEAEPLEISSPPPITSRSSTVLRPMIRISSSSTSTWSTMARMQARRNGVSPVRTFVRITSTNFAIFSCVIRASGRVSESAVKGDLGDIALILYGADALFKGRVGGIGDSAFYRGVESAETLFSVC